MSDYDLIIRPKRHAFDINFKEIWQYRDLLLMFVKRDVITVYKQTVLGPIWFVVQPILTTITYIVVFGNIAKISTDGTPMALFYLSGIVIWNYFSESFTQTSDTFMQNSQIFGKVYFPRLIMPLSKVISGLIKFFIQLCFFLLVYAYYLINDPGVVQPNWTIALIPFYVLIMSMTGLGLGILFTSMTTKYRDLKFLITFGVQLLMYATPVIYPMSTIPEGKFKMILQLNPLSPIVESFKYSFLGAGEFSLTGLAYSLGFALVALFLGMIVFHKTERNFIDTV
ncbi:ABC transporter permease [Xiashengella succiniciproducens]|jgi:lipopolysaccharide transport system permease protein|uniref:Transport permease protein n=1 Tax=Xiashengella succiniciproducens TaxID=2949635 RepID=A0A9J6ZTA9_9BACT|nr:ABC transporter permease [Alkaliflexus sp. Ai-910]URW80803.1 ABC transporter permease [Alkaliflexus sp. Ai-910]